MDSKIGGINHFGTALNNYGHGANGSWNKASNSSGFYLASFNIYTGDVPGSQPPPAPTDNNDPNDNAGAQNSGTDGLPFPVGNDGSERDYMQRNYPFFSGALATMNVPADDNNFDYSYAEVHPGIASVRGNTLNVVANGFTGIMQNGNDVSFSGTASLTIDGTVLQTQSFTQSDYYFSSADGIPRVPIGQASFDLPTTPGVVRLQMQFSYSLSIDGNYYYPSPASITKSIFIH